MLLAPAWVWAADQENQTLATLDAAVSQEVLQDHVQATAYATAKGTTAAEVNAALTKALDEARRGVPVTRGVVVSTGQFSTYLEYNDKREVTGWTGRAGLVISGKNLQGVAAVLSQVSQTLAIGSVRFSLSPEARREQEQALLKTLAQAFRDKAQAVTAAFGFGSYEIVTLNFSDSAVGRPMPVFSRAASPSAVSASTDVSLVPALARVSLTVAGQIRLNK
jgi:predicted secreted protein